MNFWRIFALNLIAAAVLVCGCGPDNGLRDLEKGRQAQRAGDLKKAERHFLESIRINPGNVDTMVELAEVSIDLGELDNAAKWIEKAQLDAAGDVDVQFLGAEIAWHKKQYDKAYELYAKLAENGLLSAELRSQAWAGIGIVEMTRNEFQLARVAFLRALRIYRRNAQAWYHLGLLYRDGFGYHDAALEQLNTYVRLEEVASPRVQKVQRLVIPGLKEMITRAASERPGVASRNSSLSASAIAKAESAWKSGQYKKALERYREALAADPLSYPAALGIGNSYLKIDPSRQGMLKALENFKTACSLRPGAFSTFIRAGELAEKLSLHSQAVEIYSRAIAADPSSAVAVDGLIRSLRRAGMGKKTILAYQRYREILPSYRR